MKKKKLTPLMKSLLVGCDNDDSDEPENNGPSEIEESSEDDSSNSDYDTNSSWWIVYRINSSYGNMTML